MRKIRSLIAAFLVVLIQITPGPFGLRPAFAVAPPSSEWVTMSSSGGVDVMVRQGHGTDGVISPPTVDDTTAKVTMPLDTGYVYQNTTTGQKAFVQSPTGGIMEVDLASGAAKQIVANDPSSYPKLKPIFDSAASQVPITTPVSIGDVFPSPAGNKSILTAGAPVNSGPTGYYNLTFDAAKASFVATQKLISIGGDRYVDASYTFIFYNFTWSASPTPLTVPDKLYWVSQAITVGPTTDPPYPSPSVGDSLNPGKVASGIKSSGFPGGTGLNGEIIQVGKKGAGTIVRPGGEGVLPEDIPLMPGYGGVAGDGAPIASDVPKDPTDSDDDKNNDAPYSPSPIGDPYPQDQSKIDFSKRMTDFFSSAKQSAIFSLPSTFANIPSGSNSAISIDAPGIFGRSLTFDFSSMNYMWAILRTVVLSGFSWVAIRIVCLKH